MKMEKYIKNNWKSVAAKKLGLCVHRPGQIEETYPTRAAFLVALEHEGVREEYSHIAGIIGSGRKIHNLIISFYDIPEIGRWLTSAHSYCGSAKWKLHGGSSPLTVIIDDVMVNCKKCLN